ncbi:1-acylglycerol-3-phosphate O-acyltransferase [Psychrobium sp. MM17-31]|uniref:1-acylglycerol-3-phosphate O-acyltransferase n=1 Tax=Psychrobium sp. MM17-31 TaxID=2917758 RepID=UPI001EF5D91F|nr:1-acylglycerol-3-phosphate O-acyltransferase [Psychrobium sp. MM17-31]MCG7529947.1 1-acylglycerol-3-phosphate O-acyltransferase [Psychrobium sp. MM17-31]
MIAVLRVIFLLPLIIIAIVGGILICLIRPFHRDNTFLMSKMLSGFAPLFGIKLIVRVPQDLSKTSKVVIGNHQNNFDVVTISAGVTRGVVSLGKKSLIWVPFFGQLYWLSGNILIDRKNKSKAAGTIAQTAEKMLKDNLSVWIFPEGTRSRGRGLLPFKTGAFHTAMQAKVDVVPIVMSSSDHISLNRWNNGVMIIESMPPIDVETINKDNVREVAAKAHSDMQAKLDQLDAEVVKLNEK